MRDQRLQIIRAHATPMFPLPSFPFHKTRSGGKKDLEKYLKENCIPRKKWLFIPGQRPPRGLTGAVLEPWEGMYSWVAAVHLLQW